MNQSSEGNERPRPDFVPPAGGTGAPRGRPEGRSRPGSAPGQLSQPPARSESSQRGKPEPPPPPGAPGAGATPEAGRWGEVLAGLGMGLVGVVAVQVLMSVLAAVLLKQTGAGATGLHHRVGFTFGSLGGATALILVVGLALLTAPAIGGRALSARQKGLLRATIPAVSALALVIVVGSVLAVVSELNELTLRGVNASGTVRLQLATFLAGGIGVPAVAIAAAGAARRLT